MTRPTAEQIQAAREDAGLTRTQAARLIGTTYTQWLRWEQGTRKMGGSRWFCFQQALERRRPHLNALKAIRQWSALESTTLKVLSVGCAHCEQDFASMAAYHAHTCEKPVVAVAPAVDPEQAAKLAAVLATMADLEAKMRRRLA